MAYADGGANSNLVIGYSPNEDIEISYGFAVQLCQTFTIGIETVFHLFVPKIEVDTSRDLQHFILYHTDASGKPTGTPICDITKEFFTTDPYEATKWRRVPFPTFPVLAPGLYALVLTVPLPHTLNKPKWAAKETSDLYPNGKAWKSSNFGLTWNEIPNTSFLFEVWGWTPPPDPPPDPVLSNWAPVDYGYASILDGFNLTITTDIPVHLYMRWTNIEPLTHSTELIRRGISLPNATRFCFVAWEENEQLEPGDTFIHTFRKPNWIVCETRWFYFIGTKQAEETPSASAIFHLHREEKYIPSTYGPVGAIGSNRTIHRQQVNWDTCHDAPTGTVTGWHDPPNYQLVAGAMFIMLYDIYRSFLTFDTSGIPPGSLIVGAALSLFLDTAIRTSSAAYPHICISKGVQSDPVVPEDYGNQLPYTTIGGQLDIGSAVINKYNDIAFNEDGLAWIDPAGFTKLCIRQEMDIVDFTPPLGQNHILYSSAQKGEGFKPLLTVYYVPP